MTTTNDLVTELQKQIQMELNVEAPDTGADLFKEGKLDSFGLVNLLFLIERRWGIQVSIDQLELDNFRTVQSIAAFIERAQAR